ncbi:MAG: flagellar basal body-associated FliL family protein [Actinomycetota bacterium]|nr:flagellar basal body-associated FliL family protein [Actinomycetota bacterium]
MTTTDTPVESTDVVDVGPAPPAKKRSNLIPALILAVGLLGAGFMVSTAMKGGDTTDEAAAAEIVPGEIVQLEPMTLNLTDGRYLRLGLAVELVDGVPGSEWVEHGGSSRYMDLIIDRVGERSGEEIVGPGGREELKELLRDGGAELFAEEFSEIYVTEFIVQ